MSYDRLHSISDGPPSAADDAMGEACVQYMDHAAACANGRAGNKQPKCKGIWSGACIECVDPATNPVRAHGWLV